MEIHVDIEDIGSFRIDVDQDVMNRFFDYNEMEFSELRKKIRTFFAELTGGCKVCIETDEEIKAFIAAEEEMIKQWRAEAEND